MPIENCKMKIANFESYNFQFSMIFDDGGPYWTRTSDSLLKRQILYRLS